MLQAPPDYLLNSALRPLIQLGLQAFLDAVQQDPRITVTSWWRSVSDNADVGGAATSQHLYGLAYDIVGPGATQVADAWMALGGIAVREADHVHLQIFPAGVL